MTTEPREADGDLLPVLWLCGAPAAGKSVTAWNLYRAHDAAQVAYVDIDQLKMLFPETVAPFRLAAENLLSLARLHRCLGTRALIVSGVIEPDELAQIDAALAGEATVTWCLVDADDDDLRTRIAARDWPAELADRAIEEASGLRGAGIRHLVDTSRLDPEGACAAADALLRLRAHQSAGPSPAAGDADAVVVIVGPRAVGKSTLSWGAFMELAGRGGPTAYLDADQLGFVHLDEGRRGDLLLHAITSLATTFREAGARRTLVNGNLSPSLAGALADGGATLVRLDAPPDVLRQRIAARHDGSPARLAGDDLEGAGPQAQADALEAAEAQRSSYAAARLPGHLLDVSGSDPAVGVAALVALVEGGRS